jgi:glycine hydroxymethyltransferase
MFANISISEFDPDLAKAIASEGERQEAHIELIASENYCSSGYGSSRK